MHASRRPWAGYLLGFALGGFFDGILLHQILQWHHLLLGVQGGAFSRLRTQLLADGLFHLLMYLVAMAGLWSLWKARTSPAISGRGLLADGLLSFGAWHILDGVVSHWLLGIHRIRMDVPDPLLWDLLWFVAFGMLPFLAGMALRRTGHGAHRDGSRRVAVATLGGLVLLAAPPALLPPAGSGQVAVLVRPGDANRLLDGMVELRGGILWADPSGALWVFSFQDADAASRLREHGALLVTRSPALLGCLAFAVPPAT